MNLLYRAIPGTESGVLREAFKFIYLLYRVFTHNFFLKKTIRLTFIITLLSKSCGEGKFFSFELMKLLTNLSFIYFV